MPAFYTHYIFGRLGYQDMREGALKQMVRRHKKVYAFGLSGPDIFFYFAPDQILLRRTPGSKMHEEKCGAFLRCMLREALALFGEEREIGIAYLAGFVAHYALDVSCHPHVYAYIEEEAALLEKGKTGRVRDGDPGYYRKGRKLRVRVGRKPRAHRVSAHEKTGIHFRYECAMDHYFLEHYAEKETRQLRQRKMVYLQPAERRVIARLVASAYNKVYDRPNMSEASVRAVLFSVRTVQRLLRDPRGRKEQTFSRLEKIVYHHPFLAGLFVNDNCYGIGQEEWKKMNALFRAGRREYKGMMEALTEVVESALKLEEVGKYGNLRKNTEERKQGPEESRMEEYIVLQEAKERHEKALRIFAQRLGSRSYHTGMPV